MKKFYFLLLFSLLFSGCFHPLPRNHIIVGCNSIANCHTEIAKLKLQISEDKELLEGAAKGLINCGDALLGRSKGLKEKTKQRVIQRLQEEEGNDLGKKP